MFRATEIASGGAFDIHRDPPRLASLSSVMIRWVAGVASYGREVQIVALQREGVFSLFFHTSESTFSELSLVRPVLLLIELENRYLYLKFQCLNWNCEASSSHSCIAHNGGTGTSIAHRLMKLEPNVNWINN